MNGEPARCRALTCLFWLLGGAELGMAAGEAIKVVHAGLVSDDDFASIIGGAGGADTPGKGRAIERGFAGTALAGIAPVTVSSP